MKKVKQILQEEFTSALKEQQIRRLNALIQEQWSKPCNNASDAHFRAQEITRLEKQKDGYETNDNFSFS